MRRRMPVGGVIRIGCPHVRKDITGFKPDKHADLASLL